jgi:hypothetical protein
VKAGQGIQSTHGSYMSQPKFQLETFKSWAGIDSDISYYLNSHHIDVRSWGRIREKWRYRW